MKPAILPLIALSLAGGCTMPETNRWDTMRLETDSAYRQLTEGKKGKPEALAYSYTVPDAPAEAPTPLTVKGLSERGQQAYIEAMARGTKTPDALREAVSLPLKAKPAAEDRDKKAPQLVSNELQRTLVVSVSKGLATKPGDRLTWARVELTPLHKAFVFTGYTIAATETDKIDIAKVTQTSTLGFGTKLSPTLGGAVVGGAEISPSVESSREVSSDIRQSFTKLDVAITPELLRITREGERNLDVNGNTLIKLTLATRSPDETSSVINGFHVWSQELDEDGKRLPPAKVSAKYQRTLLPRACPLEAKVQLIYELRQADVGASTYSEGDDTAVLTRGVTENVSVLVPAREVVPALWELHVQTPNGPSLIHADIPLLGQQPLLFTDYDNARNFAEWMNAYPGHGVGGASFVAGDGTELKAGGKVSAERVRATMENYAETNCPTKQVQ